MARNRCRCLWRSEATGAKTVDSACLNSVVLVSYIRGLREDGLDREEAVRLGCEQRFRPVMMTATVALLGLVPFLFATGPGSEVQRPLSAGCSAPPC
jgi:Cu/Ag efflux pump CusA